MSRSQSAAVPDHEHVFRQDTAQPVIEDGAAIFVEVCTWVETTTVEISPLRTEEIVNGDGCPASRQYRMETAWVEQKRGDAPNITYLGSELDAFSSVKEQALNAVECGGGQITAHDPDEEYGYVTVETEDWRVKFKANCSPQISPRPR